MTNEVSIRITANDDSRAVRDKVRAAYAALGVEAAAAFNTSASMGMRDAGSNSGAAAADAAREMAVMGFGVAGADAAKEFGSANTKGMSSAGGDSGAAASDAAREMAMVGFGVAGNDAASEFTKATSQGMEAAGSTAGADASTAARVSAVAGFGSAGQDASAEFDKAASKGFETTQTELSTKMRSTFATTGTSTGMEFSEKFKESTEKQAPAKVPVEAKNPIDEAWRSQIQASIRSVAADAIKIPMSPDTVKFREEAQFLLGNLQHELKTEIPVEVGEADKFKLRAEALVKEVSDEVKAKIPVEADEQSADEAGKKAGNSFVSGLTGRQALIGTAIAAGVLGGGPVIVAAGIATGVGMLTALGATIQKGNPAIQAGWAKLQADATTAAQGASAGMVAPLTQAMGQIDALIQRESPEFRKLFTDAAADIPILTQGVDGFVSNSLPGLEAGLANSQSVVKATSGLMADLGGAVGQVGSQFGQNSAEVTTSLHALGSVVDQTGTSVSTLLDFSTQLASGALPTLASGLNGVLSAADGVLHALGPMAPVLGQIAVYGAEAWGSFKLAGVASVGVMAMSKGLDSLSVGLTSAGAKMLNTSAGSTKVGAALAEAAGKGALFAGSAASMAETVAGPLGIALGLGSMALMLFGQNSDEASKAQQQQQGVAQSLTQILVDSNGVIDANVQKQQLLAVAGTDAGKALLAAGFSQDSLNKALIGGPDALQGVIDGLQKQDDAIKNNAANWDNQTGEFDTDAQKQVSAIESQINPLKQIKGGMDDSAKAAKALRDAQDAQAASYGVLIPKLSSTQRYTEAVAAATNYQVQQYMQSISAIKQYADAQVAAAGANLTATANFKQYDAAVTQAEQAVASASTGIASAQHSLVDAGHAVDAARHSEQQAVQGVTDAQYSYQQALQSEKQAQTSLMAARQAAADQLAALQRQVIDQGDTEAEAKLRLLQAQEAVNAAGLHGKTLAGLGDPTAANQTQYDLLLKLQEAQHNLNDVNVQTADLNKQNATAQAAGVDGSQGVIQAQQQLVQAQRGVQQASRAVADAQYAEQQASQAVVDAVWSQHSAQLALTQAQQAGLKAQQDLTNAKDADSRTLDINTQAGNRNWQTVEDLYFKNLATSPTIDDAKKKTEDETTALGFNQGAVQGVIDTLNGLSGRNFAFSVTGTPTLDLGPVRGILQDPTLGLFTNQKGSSGGIASAGRLAAGGHINGPGGPTDDAIHAMLSAGEYVQPADSVNYYGVEYMDAIRKKRLPRYASGGPVSPTDLGGIMGLNAGAAAGWGLYETAGLTANAMGARPQLPTKMPAAGNFSRGAFAGAGLGSSGPVPGVPSSRAANEAIVNAIWAGYGWNAGAEWDATVHLLMQESGFNNTAQNPTSTAYGMFQFLDTTWAGYGVPKTSDPTAQSIAGGRYLKSRYGDPLGAWAHERAFNWYGAGGPAGGLIGVGDRGPELINVPNGSTVMSNVDSRSVLAGSNVAPEIKVTLDVGGTNSGLATLIMNMIRNGEIQILSQYIHK